MKPRLLSYVLTVIIAITSTNCVAPTGTPQQRAAQTKANAELATGVGIAALGIGAAFLGASQLQREYRYRHHGYYYGRYQYRYYHPSRGYWYSPY